MAHPISKAKALEHLQSAVAGMPLKAGATGDTDFIHWRNRTKGILANLFGENADAVKEFNAIQWNPPGDTKKVSTAGMSLFTIPSIPKILANAVAMERGFRTAHGQLESLLLRLDLWPDDSAAPAVATNLAVTDPIPPLNSWSKLSERDLEVASCLFEATNQTMTIEQLNQHVAWQRVPPAILRLKELGIVDFAGSSAGIDSREPIRFIGNAQKQSAESRASKMAEEPLNQNELQLLDKILECCPAVGDCFNGAIVTGLGFNLHFSDQETNTMFGEMKEKKAIEHITGGLYSVPTKGREAVLAFRRQRRQQEPAPAMLQYNQFGGQATMNVEQHQNQNRDGVQNIAGRDQKIATGDGNVIGDEVRITKVEGKPRWLAKVLTEKALWIIGCLLLAVFVYWLKHPAK